MKYIVNRRQTRKLVEVDKEPLAFEVRGDIVDDAKIDRWMNSRGMSVSALYPPSPGARECEMHLMFTHAIDNP